MSRKERRRFKKQEERIKTLFLLGTLYCNGKIGLYKTILKEMEKRING